MIEEPANAPASGAYLLTLFSANPDRRWDNTDTIVQLGYRPQGSWDVVQRVAVHTYQERPLHRTLPQDTNAQVRKESGRGPVTIPDYQTLMLPLLRLLADREPHSMRNLADRLSGEFQLSQDERAELLPSGRQTVILNRVSWARTYMAKAGLVESSGRGMVRITDRGIELLSSKPNRVDVHLLMAYPEFVAFRTREPSPGPIPDGHGDDNDNGHSPEETFEASYQQLHTALAAELLERITKAPPDFFERLVVDLLVAMGYGGSHGDVVQAFGRSGDDGIDGIIKEDRLGLDFVYVQAKRWANVVGRPVVQGFAGSLEGQRARKGVFITTSTFSKEAHDYVTRIEKRIVLIDGEELASLMIDYGVGVADVATYRIKRVDLDYFSEV